MSSLITPTIASAKVEKPNPLPKIIKVEQYDKAEYKGVLMTEWHFVQYEKAWDENEILQARLKDIAKSHQASEEKISKAWYILGGVLLGFSATLLD